MKHQTNSDQMIPQADKQAHTEIAERVGRDGEQSSADDEQKMRSDDTVPQSDKQAHTEVAQRAGRTGGKK